MNPQVYTFMGFAITSSLFLSSLLLVDYAKSSKDTHAYKVYRRDTIVIGPITLIMAGMALFVPDKNGVRGLPRVAVALITAQYLLASYVLEEHIFHILFTQM
jgi:cytochrome d ubiquinol oxidase subunit II